jgi:hypothetical protein
VCASRQTAPGALRKLGGSPNKEQTMTQFRIAALSAACLLAMGTSAFATESKSEYDAAKAGIKATYKTDKAACQPMSGNAKDICSAEAKGRENVALAELEAKHEPSVKHRYLSRMAKADATYAIAKERCDDQTGNAKDVCRKEAKAAFVSAKADAKASEKVSNINTVSRDKTVEVRKDAAADKRDAEYAVAKEKCNAFAADAKAGCIKDAKTLYNKS